MWQTKCKQLSSKQILQWIFEISFGEALVLLRDDEEFRDFLLQLLIDTPFSAYRWETPSLTNNTSDRPFEFVLINSPGLARRADIKSFAEHFQKSAEAVQFTNLSGDAILVVPCPHGPETAYVHLAAFVREAPRAQCHQLLRLLAQTTLSRMSAKAVWLSTAGAGVAWLHVRLDDRPKYYHHKPYAER
jgi:hypothetical protein